MSSIEKLTIQGIRSFGAEDGNKQIIKFKPPLTLILGPNGSGKTTIIECLRYMTTGDMPPNSNRGGYFVHDPKIAHETSVKGKIEMKLTNMAKKKFLITRSLEATQTPKDVRFKTLDNTITSKDVNGEAVHLSSKCADIDREISSLLGVSKAILNNVIFCHQEESNWPLSEGKALKQKFDDIFAATRYIKALDSIKKERASLGVKVKEFEIALKYLAENKTQATKLKADLDNLHIKLLSSENRVKEIDEQLQPIQKVLDDIFRTEIKITKVREEIAKNEAVEGELKKKQIELNQNIQTLFKGDGDELKTQINDFQSELRKKKLLNDKYKNESLSMERQSNSLKKKRSELQEQFGAINGEHQNHLKRISIRDSNLIKFCHELNVAVPTLGKSLSENDVANLIHEIGKKIKNEEEQLASAKRKHNTLEQELQSQLDTLKEKRTKLSHSCTLNKDQVKENKKKSLSITEELNRVDALANKQVDLEENITQIEKELESEEFSEEHERLQKKLNDKKKEKVNVEVLLNQLSAELSKLQKEHEIRASADLLIQDKKSKEAEINKIKSRNQGAILHLLGKIPENNVHQQLQKYVSNIWQDIQNDSDKIEKKKLDVSSHETTRRHLVKNLKSKEQDLEAYKRKVFRVCGNDDYDTSFATLEKKVKELQDEKGALIGSQYIFSTYMEKLKNMSPCCPLCHRGFAEDKQAKELICELENKMKMVPTQLRTKQKNIEEYQIKLNDMTELRPIREEIKKLEKDIPALRNELKTTSEEIENHQSVIEELNEVLQSNKSDHATACSLLKDTVLWDQCSGELKRLEFKLSNLTCHLGGADMTRNMQTVCDEQDNSNLQLDSIKAEIEKYQRDLEERSDRIWSLKNKKNDLKSELLQITSNLQQKSSREEEKRKLTSENIDLENCIKETEAKLLKLEEEIENLSIEKERLRKEKEEELDMLQKKIGKLEKQLQDIVRVAKDISNYINDKKEEKLKSAERQLEDRNKEMATIEERIQQLGDKMDELNKEIANHQIKERELQDNLKLFECNHRMEEVNEKLSNLRKQLKESGIQSLLSEKQELVKKYDDLSSTRHQVLGEQKVRKKEVLRLQEDLQNGMYKDADLKHHNKLIEIRTTQVAAEDLNKYYIALDCAIMRYHSMKMEEINKIIRELWVQTYGGNDIDYIEIRSDAQDGNPGLDKRRTYNYKVVMIKRDIAVDMRGRCSAGQKVLASLITRLALAETFCLNCGILALDEPTTNLDRDNIEKLAQALIGIVEARSNQTNFQLIVITHDEDFIGLLGTSDAVDDYYRVTRDDRGMSKIKKSLVQSIM